MIKAMIVDDEYLVRLGLKLTMPWDQFSIVVAGEAKNAEEALSLLAQERFDLMFVDITMPGMSGLELLDIIRSRHLPVHTVVLICHQEFDYVQQALRLGAIDYLVKTQLATEHMEQSLRRIVDRIEAAGRGAALSDDVVPVEAPMDGSKLRELWLQLKWLMDDELLSRMLRSLQTMEKNERRELLNEASDYWAECLPAYADLFERTPNEGEERMEQIVNWLNDVRRLVISRLIQTNYSEEVICQILKAVDIIQQSNGKQYTQEELCTCVNISRSYFSKCFKDVIGVPFVAYVQDVGLKLAKKLLAETNLPVYHVAEQAGFQDEKYFSKLFRERTGTLPSRYRANSRQ